MLHGTLVVLAAVAIVGYVIGRQLLGEPQRGKRLILLPLILTVIGAIDLGKDGLHPQAIDVIFIVASGLVAAAIGLRQGALMRLESRDGALWGQMPIGSLWLWGALVASRVFIGVVASASGAHVAASTASVLLVIGVNRLAQAAVIAPRAMMAGIPFAPEKDGSTFLGEKPAAARHAAGLTRESCHRPRSSRRSARRRGGLPAGRRSQRPAAEFARRGSR